MLFVVQVPSRIVSEALNGVPREVLAVVPNKMAMQQVVHRERSGGVPANPGNRADIIVPEQYQYYIKPDGNREKFLLIDSGPADENRLDRTR